MGVNLVNLNVNPCKMCMPMGSVSAFCGIKNCMSILHGSQGCATYIRRHMATHYNEPVDIASSSLTEEGTVFGGQKNLIAGLKNLMTLYSPEIIGIATSCLAETIGEDVSAIVKKFKNENPEFENVKIVTVSSAGYAGTQYEGWFKTLRAIVEQLTEKSEKNEFINIITPQISPADVRWLKSFLDKMGVKYILLPDISENLDGVSVKKYERLKSEGTTLEDIKKMSGAKFTIEFSDFIENESSPAIYLEKQYGVPFIRLTLPIGIQSMDSFIKVLVENGGGIHEDIAKERGRYLDAMVDSHKYCAEGRVAILGEPNFVYAISKMCCENGILPVLLSTGSVSPGLAEKAQDEILELAEKYFVNKTEIIDDCDFEVIEKKCLELGVNALIGSSDARRIESKLGIKLFRCAFPIHDRVGGQRVRILGFDGSLNIMDTIANIMLSEKEENFRKDCYNKYFNKYKIKKVTKEKEKESTNMNVITPEVIAKKTAEHPCYNCGASKNARIHLPVAPKCNIQCNYCVRKFDCPNESRLGVTTEVLSPEEAFRKYVAVKEKMPNLTVVGIAGPGDALANFAETKKTLQLIKEYDENITFCLSTNGLMLPLYAQELIELGITHLTVTVNAVDPVIGAKIYKHVDYMGVRYTGEAGAAVLMANQLTGIKYLTSRGIVCKINSVVLKGINDKHIEDITKKSKELGAYISNIMPHIPVIGSAFESLDTMNNKEITELRKKCEVNTRQMYHCRQCRSDAIGTLDNDLSIEFRGCSKIKTEEKNDLPKLKFAVATKSGMLVDQHFGHASEFYIYESDGNTANFLEKRLVDKYCVGKESCDDHESKMSAILAAVDDCNAVLALRIGDAPTKKLNAKGIKTITTYDRIEDAVKTAAQKTQTINI